MPQLNWNLKSEAWDNIDKILTTKDWKSIKFLFDSRVFLPKTKGIYMISLSSNKIANVKPFSTLVTPVYIGISTNLRKRFVDHAYGNNEALFRKHLFDFRGSVKFWWLEVDVDITKLKMFEQSLIDLFGGSLNQINSVAENKIVIKTLKET